MSSRRTFSESSTELDDQVRSKNPPNAFRNFRTTSTGKSFSRCFTSFELKKAGMASKKLFSESSSPRALIVQSKIWMSIFDDRFDTVSSAAFSTSSDVQWPLKYGHNHPTGNLKRVNMTK